MPGSTSRERGRTDRVRVELARERKRERERESQRREYTELDGESVGLSEGEHRRRGGRGPPARWVRERASAG
jgi:hypothetical protein